MNAPFSTQGSPQAQIVVFTPAMRTLIADAIESMMLLLDEIDGDADFEDEPDQEGPDADHEPDLGSTHSLNQELAWRATLAIAVDCEMEHDGREPDADGEPTWVADFASVGDDGDTP